jgi:hypothetical protein
MNTDPSGIAARACGKDITRNRHGGNAMSHAAFLRIVNSLPEQRGNVLRAIESAGTKGLTCRELSERWKCGMNVISGRFSELHKAGHITRLGERDGCAVWVSND